MGILIGIGGTEPKFLYNYFYGIEWDTNVADSACTRLGRPEPHVSLPIQSLMYRCILNDTGNVVYYLHANDPTKRDNGATADLMGATGQAMVEISEHYVHFEMEGTKRRCLMSIYALPGFRRIPKMYISAYETVLRRSTLKLSSVVNTSADYRGGGNQTAWDELSKTQLGRPATAISLTNFRKYVRNRGPVNWDCDTYFVQRALYWLRTVEYANFSCQLVFSAQPTSEGCRQGDLGAGVTMVNSMKWGNLTGYYPPLPRGATNSSGNATGVVNYNLPQGYDTTILTVGVPSYRGIENPSGHIWSWVDGCKCCIQSETDGGLSEFYACEDPQYFQNTNYSNYELRDVLPRKEGYIKEMIIGGYGRFMPLAVGAESTTYFSNYLYTNIPTPGEAQRGVLFGGSSTYGAYVGVGCLLTHSTAPSTYANVGSRLCFLPGV